MAAENELQVHAGDEAGARVAAKAAIDEVHRIEAKYSRYRPESVVSRINASAGSAPVAIDDETSRLLDFADTCWRQSDGLFDPTSGILRRAWRFDSPRIPTDAELAPLLALIGWDKVERDASSIRLPTTGMELDFGGFGKEYAVDRAAAVLRAHGVESAFASLAGDLLVLGEQPGGEAWQVGIQHPRERHAILARLPVGSGGVATSGDYERFIEVDGVRHCHILDPHTGRSARGLQSVTVHATSCIVAGSASTIAMLKGASEGVAWLDALGLPYYCVTEDGTIVHTFR